ncbi:MAG: trypsin-like peptidase domain-containing protein [Bdellovibrionaceae bacterium]|nr:trypsin-like peptidase domain-containing protein [Pseudobdellovibrionaceae bacterium]
MARIKPHMLMIGIAVLFVSPWNFSQASRGDLCDKTPLKKETTFARDLLAATEIGTAYSYGTGYKEAAIYGKDDRVEVDRRAYPFRTVGRLLTEWEILDDNGNVVDVTQFSCTATLVSDCHLLSARHCVVDQKDSSSKGAPRKRLRAVQFIDALGRGHSIATTKTGATTKPSDDYAFLKLSSSPGKELGFVPFARRSSEAFPVGTKFIAAGFNSDLKNGDFLTADMGAEKVAPSTDPKILALKADTFTGASGGPIFAMSEKNVPYIAGVHSMAIMKRDPATGQIVQSIKSDDEKQKLSVSVASESFAPGLKKFIQGSSCR